MQPMIKLNALFWVLILLWVPSWAHAEHDSFGKMGVVAPKISKPAPEFSSKNIKGETVQLSDFKGKVVLLNFWATWCGACKEEMASMQSLYSSLRGDGVEVIAVSIDRWNEDRVQEFSEANHLTFPVLLDQNQKIRRQYHVMGLPTSYLIDREGKIRGYASGARDWGSSDSHEMLLSLEDIGSQNSLPVDRLSMQAD